MVSRSIYLDDAQEEWVKRNIQNFSDWARSKIDEEKNKKDEINKANKKNNSLEMIGYILFSFSGFAFLVFAIIIWAGGINITYFHVILFSLLIGTTLEIYALISLVKYKTGMVKKKWT